MYFGIEDKSISLFLERLIDGPNNELIIFVCDSVKGEPLSEKTLNAEVYEPLRKILSNCT